MKLTANKRFHYNTRRLMAGDEFDADDRHARTLVAAQLASHADAELPDMTNIDSLRAHAARRGVNVDRRWGVRRLRSEIEARK